MAYSSNYVYYTIRGGFGLSPTTLAESWQVGFKLRQASGSPTETNLTNFMETMSAAVLAFHGNAGVSAGNIVKLTETTAAFVGTDGKYVGGGLQNTVRRTFSGDNAGAGIAYAPYQIACTYTMLTAVSRGPGSHGRFYYPCLSRSWDGANDQWQAAACLAAANAAVTLIKAINTAAASQIPGNSGVWVMSQKGISASVSDVQVGRVPDTQRRRRRQAVEDPQHASTPVLAIAQQLRDQPIGELDVSEFIHRS